MTAATPGQASWTARALFLEGNPDNADDHAEIIGRWDTWFDDHQREAEEVGAQAAIAAQQPQPDRSLLALVDAHFVGNGPYPLQLVCWTEDASDVECDTEIAEVEPGVTWDELEARIVAHAAECHAAARAQTSLTLPDPAPQPAPEVTRVFQGQAPAADGLYESVQSMAVAARATGNGDRERAALDVLILMDRYWRDPNHEPGLSECGCRECDPGRHGLTTAQQPAPELAAAVTVEGVLCRDYPAVVEAMQAALDRRRAVLLKVIGERDKLGRALENVFAVLDRQTRTYAERISYARTLIRTALEGK